MASRFGNSKLTRFPLAAAALAALAALVALGGCGRTTLKASLVEDHGERTATSELDFWDEMVRRRAVTNHDALHALILSFTGKTPTTYEARLELAQGRRWLPADETPPRNETARVGWIARAVCLETGLRGGLTMRVFGPRERYAVKELNYLQWLPNMSPQQAVSGLQLIALLSNAEDFTENRPVAPQEDKLENIR